MKMKAQLTKMCHMQAKQSLEGNLYRWTHVLERKNDLKSVI